jgi:serine/threonine-protein kinase PknG
MEPCRRPGCTGVIEDGYCSECGLAPEGAAPAPVTSGTLSSRSGRTSSTRSTRTSRSSSTRRRASGVALSALPPIPPIDPLAALMAGEVPERKRFCSNCDAKLNRESGFCPKCGQQYSFKPSLKPGSVVAGKYEVKGTVAFGGLGWIYLAMDTVLNRWVVLKGLLNSKDPNMVRVAVQEREFLAAVKHRNIVGIYDFITQGHEGFIVMEYVNGKSLLQLRREHGGPLPPLDACSYILELLPAFSYLDAQGMVYCDFKIENAIVEGETVKLIDMGAVRRADDSGGDVYGTKGYAAPEASEAPTALSDLYTVGRALALLVVDFDFQGAFEHSLPAPADAPAFRQFPSLHRFLLKATRPDPAARFQSADEMAGQLQGVLRDVAAGTGVLPAVDSMIFDPDTSSELLGDEPVDLTVTARSSRSHRLPDPRPVAGDTAAPAIVAASLIPDAQRRFALLQNAWEAHPDSLDLPFRLAGAAIEAGARDQDIAGWLEIAAKVDPSDWRSSWYRGQASLRRGDGPGAVQLFDAVLAEVPGELAPKLALGYAFELAGDLDAAGGYFDLVSKADPSYTSAAFGLARCQRARGDRDGAVAALERVPPSSSRYESSRLAMAEVLLDDKPTPPGEPELARASDVLEQLRATVDSLPVHRLSARLLVAAAEHLERSGTKAAPTIRLLGVSAEPASLRKGGERELRACAHLAATKAERIRYIDAANQARPFTLV